MTTEWNFSSIHLDKGEVRMDIKSLDPFWTNQTVKIPKLISYAVDYLVRCPYID